MGSNFSAQTTNEEAWTSDARYAMQVGRYCVICGSPFDIEGDHNVDPKEPRYQVRFLVTVIGV